MHSRRTVLTTAAAAAAAATGAGAGPAHGTAHGTAPAIGLRPAAPAPSAATRARLRRLISRMTPEEKVGQLFVMRVYGHSATDPDPADAAANQKEIGVANAAELIAKYHVGGIIYFGWAHNTREPHQIADLSNGIQKAAAAQRLPVPVLISTDQEHGIVARVGAPATLFPGAMALGAGGSRDDARTAARIAGEELFAMGIRQDYAPDADVNVNPANPVIGVRSFGADPQAVARMVAAEVKGYQGAGIASCAKHFPGHGDTDIDSHVGLPYIHHSAEEWERLDAPPFRAAIAAGIDSIMTAHIVVPAFDPSEDPATLSRPILTGILRERLGYDGVVVTDSLGMEGVRVKYGDARVPVLALKAGVDQLLNPPDLSVAHGAVLTALREGELTERDLDTKLMRILLLKERRGLFKDPYTTHQAVDRAVGTRGHLAAADRIAERTTTLLRNDTGILPLSRLRERRVLVAGVDVAAPSGTGGPPTTVLARALTELGFTATALSTGQTPTQQRIDEAVAALGERDAVVVATYNVTAASGQRKLVDALLATGKPVVQLAVRNPYDIAQLGGVRAALASYSWTDVELRAAARVIAGQRDPAGRLPVPIMRADAPTRALYQIGHGLTY
ncbi:glycoside hydrolase family 3 protein [Streptomyces nigrescens]|uniref:beta-N-acetylhexosaminidase n=2 Tax=Streptomyces nigrescens TaxID=1920 RepID=A0A640TQU8_STRNI|nr:MULTISPECIES: glycoside hydrolase family 3 protein [Streptomyces]WAT98915.1 glycoside hydrolase family 3 protein [Streptomyces libani subsp. libani]WAU06893.1 glycoside hydrolase family 3 protein [Streptomyces nigrescens]GFE24586.1 beta-N-acetylhexosaminidase [Streptomyces libani subsp. libani]GGV94731.1 beta-N-acetylhexosaminidase [Streptomyces libani subsp. libani]